MYYKRPIETSPLQAYVSPLVFSPGSSLVRELFSQEEPQWIIAKPSMTNGWSLCIQTLEGHRSCVTSLTYSRNGIRLASALWDYTIKL